MSEGRKKLNLTMKVTDKLVNLSLIVSKYDEYGPDKTVKLYNEWMEDTKKFLQSDFDEDHVRQFNELNNDRLSLKTPDGITEATQIHTDYLFSLVENFKE